MSRMSQQWQLITAYLFAATCLTVIIVGAQVRAVESTNSSIQLLTQELRAFNQDLCVALNEMHVRSGVGTVVRCDDGRMELIGGKH